MGICYVIESISGHLGHILPLYSVLGGVLTSPNSEIHTSLIKNGYRVVPYDAIKYIKNIVVAHQCNLREIAPNSNVIQVFHGVSDKLSYYLAHLPEHYDYLIFHHLEGYKHWITTYSEHANKALTSNYTRATCYKDTPPPEDFILYCPTWKSAEILEELKGIEYINKLSPKHRVKVKLHPNTDSKIASRFRNCEIIQETGYLEEELKKAKLLISDFSSMAYEFTLTKRPIILIKNSIIKPMLADYAPWIEPSELDQTIDGLTLQNYPNFFYEEDIVEVIKQCLK